MPNPNPYLQGQADQIASNLNQNLQTNIMPNINSGAIAAGGFGGSRQGIAQGLGIGQTQNAIGNAQSNLYYNAYNTDQQINAQQSMQSAQLAAQQAMQKSQLEAQERMNNANLGLGYFNGTNSYNLGLGNLGLGNKTADQSFYTAQRGQDLQQLGLGAQLAQQGNSGLAGQGTQLWNLGLGQQQAPQQQMQWYQQMLSPFTGLGGSRTESTPGGSALGGALSGGLTVAQLLQLLSK